MHIETAPTGRAKCRTCRQAIAKGEPRTAENTDMSYADGDPAVAFRHLRCAATHAAADAFRAALNAYAGDVADRDELLAIVQRTEDRLAPFLADAAWKSNAKGNLVYSRDGVVATVFDKDGINWVFGREFGPGGFATLDAAKADLGRHLLAAGKLPAA